MPVRKRTLLTRRRFITTAASAAAASVAGGIAKPYLSRAADRPLITHGMQSGDVSIDSGVVWARTDRPARMLVEAATTESFSDIRSAVVDRRAAGERFHRQGAARGLPAGQDIFYRVAVRRIWRRRRSSAKRRSGVSGPRRSTAARVSFTWSGDTAGQGWGIDEARGGMRSYATMLQQSAGLLHPFRRQHLCRLSD